MAASNLINNSRVDTLLPDNFCKMKIAPQKICCDYTVSLGEECRPAHYLRIFRLRLCSNPLDWMMEYSLATALHLLQTDFLHFFKNVNDISAIRDNGSFSNRFVRDVDNGVVSMHDFPKTEPLQDYLPKFYQIMQRRVKRMRAAIINSNRVLFICNRQTEQQELKASLLALQKYYAVQAVLVNIRNSEKEYTLRENITEDALFVEYGFSDIHPNGNNPENLDFWQGNVPVWHKIMRAINLSEKNLGIVNTFN